MPSGPEPSLLVRADASAAVGLGHVMRCRALAQAWRQAGSDVGFIGMLEPAIAAVLEGDGFSVQAIDSTHPDARDLARMLARARAASKPAWVALDGYQFDAAYEAAVRDAGARVISLDDEDRRGEYAADIVLNQNLHGPTLPYVGAAAAIVLAGPRYALLRQEFRSGGGRRVRCGPVRQVIVLTGGADPAGIGALALDAIGTIPGREFAVTIVAGPSNASGPALAAAASALRVEVVVNPPDLSRRMSDADLAIAASGSTAWELAYLGVPAIYLSAADNQAALGEAIAKAGVGVYLGPAMGMTAGDVVEAVRALSSEPDRLARMSEAALALIDGDGAGRVRSVARALDGAGPPPAIRRVAAEDARAVWRMANDPAVRASSFTRDAIPFKAHERWFGARLAARDERFWVADVEGAILGHVRYAITVPGAAEVHFTVAAPARGRGLAAELLSRTALMAAEELEVTRIAGVALHDNPGSHRTFEKAGYRRAGLETISGRECVRFERDV